MTAEQNQPFRISRLGRNEGDYNGVGPTAAIVAYRRTLTDIPYSRQIFAGVEQILQQQGDPPLRQELTRPEITPLFEARYKLTSRLLGQSGITQVFEIASGLSPRGLEVTVDPAIQYVEFDQPGVVRQKKLIVDVITAGEGRSRENLRLTTGNALETHEVLAAASQFDGAKPIAVVNEGLLRYLSHDEKAIVASNVHTVLEMFGGVWITPDVDLKVKQDENAAATHAQNNRIRQLTGVNVEGNLFDSVDDAQVFFEASGFSVERHSFIEVADELVSPQLLDQTPEQVEKRIGSGNVFVMKPSRPLLRVR